ncbi:MAG TPA: aldo/keto reductase [Candidatus Glassbacteria bacterium]|nr:aldo/keto reductase [Candidatus Glassbacteria bacterium]
MKRGTANGFVRRRLGRTGLEVSEISLGCWTLGGPNWADGQPVGWGELDESQAARGVERGLELGCNHWDSADVYGNGRSERMLGSLTASRRAELVIATKVGWFQGCAEFAFHPLHIRHQIEQSLENLQTDYVDIYYFHHADFGPEDRYLDAAVEVMNRLKEEGKIRFIGQSAYTVEDFVRVVPKVDPDILQARAHGLDIMMIEPSSPVAKLIKERDLGFVAFSPMAQGLLLDKFRPEKPPVFADGDNRQRSRWFKTEYLEKLAPRLDRIKERFGSKSEDLVRVSLQYLLGFKAVSCVIPGFRNVRQVEMNLAPAGRSLTQDEINWITDVLADVRMT